MLLQCNDSVKHSVFKHNLRLSSLPLLSFQSLPVYILCDITYHEPPKEAPLPPGQQIAKQVQERHERRQFYVDSLTGPERSKLAARFLRKIPEQYRRMALREMSIADLAYGEVFSQELYGW